MERAVCLRIAPNPDKICMFDLILLQEANFVMSFSPLYDGRNELEIKTVKAPTSRVSTASNSWRVINTVVNVVYLIKENKTPPNQ